MRVWWMDAPPSVCCSAASTNTLICLLFPECKVNLGEIPIIIFAFVRANQRPLFLCVNSPHMFHAVTRRGTTGRVENLWVLVTFALNDSIRIERSSRVDPDETALLPSLHLHLQTAADTRVHVVLRGADSASCCSNGRVRGPRTNANTSGDALSGTALNLTFFCFYFCASWRKSVIFGAQQVYQAIHLFVCFSVFLRAELLLHFYPEHSIYDLFKASISWMKVCSLHLSHGDFRSIQIQSQPGQLESPLIIILPPPAVLMLLLSFNLLFREDYLCYSFFGLNVANASISLNYQLEPPWTLTSCLWHI